MASRSLFDMEMRASVAALSLALVALQDIVSPVYKLALSAVRAMKSWGPSSKPCLTPTSTLTVLPGLRFQWTVMVPSDM